MRSIDHAVWLAPALLLGSLATAAAQQRTGRVEVTVRSDSAPLAEARVRAGRIAGLTDLAGGVRLTLPVGGHLLVASRIGYGPDSARIRVGPDSTSQVTLTLASVGVELEELVVVSSARVERHLDEEPVRVEVLGGEDVAEKTQMRPADLTRLLTEMVGVRMQPTGGALGSTRLRLQGLKGQYSAIVADGLPIYGAEPGGLAVLQLAPLDLKQAEVIKGPATAFYGASALGGVLNLISKRPGDDRRTLVLNRTSRGGTDGLYWGGERLSPTAGVTLFADGHHQELRDISGDDWADYPRFTRFSLLPRLYLDQPNGDQLFATLGARAEDRTGGSLTPGNYRESLESRHLDAGLIYRRALAGDDRLTVRASGMIEREDRKFGGAPERNRRHTLLGEVSWSARRGAVDWVVGGAWQDDGLTARDVAGVSYDYSVPAGFAQLGLKLAAALSTSLAGRCDVHQIYGTFCSPRAALLLKPASDLSLRASAGLGFFGPTPITEETDAIGLGSVVFPHLSAERARTASLDGHWQHGAFEVSATVSRSRITGPVRLDSIPGDPAGRLRFANATGPTDVWAGELFGVYAHAPIVLTLFYGYLHSTEEDPAGGRRESALTPRHAAGADLAWEAPATGTWIALEAFYTGRQALEDDPTRTRSVPYLSAELLAAQRIGPIWLFGTLDNIGGYRITRSGPLLLPAPAAGGRRTITPWGPVEGRSVALGAMTRF